jgi:hypothetical protein
MVAMGWGASLLRTFCVTEGKHDRGWKIRKACMMAIGDGRLWVHDIGMARGCSFS